MKASMGRYTEELKKQMKDGSVMKVWWIDRISWAWKGYSKDLYVAEL